MPATKGSRAPERRHRVAQARRRAGLSQQQLAEKIDVRRATIARMKAGRHSPSVALALKLSAMLGEPVEVLGRVPVAGGIGWVSPRWGGMLCGDHLMGALGQGLGGCGAQLAA